MGRLIVGFLAALLFCTQPAFGQGRVFYDGFEGGTGLWSTDQTRIRCTTVSSATDGVVGAYSGSYFLRCNEDGTVAWNSDQRYETLTIPISCATECLIRYRFRRDQNAEATGGSPKKIGRIWNDDRSIDAFVDVIYPTGGLKEEGVLWGAGIPSYWGSASGDHSAEYTSWHLLEFYINSSAGRYRVWHDNILVVDYQGATSGSQANRFYITSNWADDHDSVNHFYFDEFEVFSSGGTGGTGSMFDGTITQGGGGGSAPTVSAVTCSPSVIQSGNGSTTCSATYGNSPTSYAWTGARSCCSFGTPSGSSTTYTCTCGGSDTLCVNATNGSGSSGATCTSSSVTYRYARPSNVSVN